MGDVQPHGCPVRPSGVSQSARIGSVPPQGADMIWKHVRIALLAGGIFAAAAVTARADDCAPAACAPKCRTVCVNEWVPETYTTTRTVYKTECRQEAYTAYRCESVPETRTRTCTTYERVCETKNVTKKVCVMVPCVENRTVCKKVWECVPETKCVRKCVDKGHWECKEVECGPTLRERLKKHFHKNDCCDSCSNDCCPRTKTVRCWVPCPTWEEHTCTVMKKVCRTVSETCQVTVCKPTWKEEVCQVQCWKCVPKCHTETYTVCVQRKVPYQCTRTVKVCVPCQETVTCCRMVCRKVEKQVPVCETSCCETTCCKPKCHGKLLSFHKKSGCCGDCGGCGGCGH